ncbi:3-hydroxybutyrate dehydrogenase [Paraburkholderia strydomiana]|uniref:3-hydroxybutyrate dehydrogenase n=1 Tax=Paraburkholderia strydomiana TaxID=1245417 RepID=UPI00285B8D4A|nr:3-hydroxybutyrate dehydrogenase [Paraburkholderia strydomiana]MDR7009960.1 3-hydroxybutyrate dehydrogenase [Paraburkholderia strydomiana]
MCLQNNVELVTGAASGIGEQCARMLSNFGASVVIADLSLEKAQRVASSIVATGGKAIAVSMDVTNEESVNAGIDRTVKELGGIDVLVSNAGTQIVAPVEAYSFADWKKILAIHLDGAFLTSKAAIRHMYVGKRGGSIVYMGSVHSHEASRLKSAYVTAKHGLLGLARVVAKEDGARGVRANVVCPGFVRTPLADKQIPEQAKELGLSEQDVVKNVMLKETVDGEFRTVEDAANTVPFLAGFESSALMGQSIIVSHGWAMN